MRVRLCVHAHACACVRACSCVCMRTCMLMRVRAYVFVCFRVCVTTRRQKTSLGLYFSVLSPLYQTKAVEGGLSSPGFQVIPFVYRGGCCYSRTSWTLLASMSGMALDIDTKASVRYIQ